MSGEMSSEGPDPEAGLQWLCCYAPEGEVRHDSGWLKLLPLPFPTKGRYVYRVRLRARLLLTLEREGVLVHVPTNPHALPVVHRQLCAERRGSGPSVPAGTLLARLRRPVDGATPYSTQAKAGTSQRSGRNLSKFRPRRVAGVRVQDRLPLKMTPRVYWTPRKA